MKKSKTARQRAAENLAYKHVLQEIERQRKEDKKRDEYRKEARETARIPSDNTPEMDFWAIAGAGGDPAKDKAILEGMYFDGVDYRPNLLNEPRPEEQVSRDFTPAWDTTYGGAYSRKPDPRPAQLIPRNEKLTEQFATSMANDLSTMRWMDRKLERQAQDEELENIVRARAESTNKGRDQSRPPIRMGRTK